MLMANEMPLITMNRGLTRKQRELMDEIDRQAAGIAARIEATGGYADVVPSEKPRWHVAIAFPGKEKIAARELSDRGFGVYVPEMDVIEVRRGRKVERKQLLLPGYVLFFGWALDKQRERARACDGVAELLCFGLRVAAVPDCVIDQIRRIENTERPLPLLLIEADADVDVKKKRKRQSRKTHREVQVSDCDIVGVHAYSPFLEELRSGSEEEWLAAFHKVMDLASCGDGPNQSTDDSPA